MRVTGTDDVKKLLNINLKNTTHAVKKLAVAKLKDNTPVLTGRARDGWKLTDKGIENDVPYIDALNNGTSKQAPKHFIEQTLLSISELTPNGVIVVQK